MSKHLSLLLFSVFLLSCTSNRADDVVGGSTIEATVGPLKEIRGHMVVFKSSYARWINNYGKYKALEVYLLPFSLNADQKKEIKKDGLEVGDADVRKQLIKEAGLTDKDYILLFRFNILEDKGDFGEENVQSFATHILHHDVSSGRNGLGYKPGITNLTVSSLNVGGTVTFDFNSSKDLDHKVNVKVNSQIYWAERRVKSQSH